MRPKVFLAAPFDSEHGAFFEAVRNAVSDAGFVLLNPEDQPSSSSPGFNVLEAIRHSDLIVADLTHQNPNVLYEVGFAHASRKRTILLFDPAGKDRFPAMFAGELPILYDQKNPAALQIALKKQLLNDSRELWSA